MSRNFHLIPVHLDLGIVEGDHQVTLAVDLNADLFVGRADDLVRNRKFFRTDFASFTTHKTFDRRDRSGRVHNRLTLRQFADKLVSIVLPRVRDFRGVSTKAFDGRGNYSLGVREQLIFPEIEYDKVEKIRGMEMIFVTTAKTDEEARELLRLLGMPFQQA